MLAIFDVYFKNNYLFIVISLHGDGTIFQEYIHQLSVSLPCFYYPKHYDTSFFIFYSRFYSAYPMGGGTAYCIVNSYI